MAKNESISKKFLDAFFIEVLKAEAKRKAYYEKKKLNLSSLPPTAPSFSQAFTFKQKTKTPELMHSLLNENEKIIENSQMRKVLLPHPRMPIARSPIVHQLPYSIKPMSSISQFISSEKIANILFSPEVKSVECKGAGKPLLITKNNIVSTSNVALTEEEISSFMKDVSQKTRIPLITGLFKALLGQFVIIAVVSEFVGTRFVIQKR